LNVPLNGFLSWLEVTIPADAGTLHAATAIAQALAIATKVSFFIALSSK
jgi:hypothetical protein